MKLHYSGAPLVDDDFTNPPDKGMGYERRSYVDWPLNGQPYNRAPSVKRLTEKEIVEWAIEKLAKKNFAIDLAHAWGFTSKDQSQSNFCHVHAPVGGMEICRCFAGLPYKKLSAFFAGSQITHGQNAGGSGVHDVKWLVENGTCDEDLWLPMKFKGTPDEVAKAKAEAVHHKIVTCEEFDPKDRQLIFSSIAQDQPVTIGCPWGGGGHEVLLVALDFIHDKSNPTFGDIRPKFQNSWGKDWGTDQGCGILDGSKFTGIDEAMRIAEVTMSKA